jgi:hypothetical protein
MLPFTVMLIASAVGVIIGFIFGALLPCGCIMMLLTFQKGQLTS